MKVSVWQLSDEDVSPAYVGLFGDKFGAKDNRVIEDQDTGHLFVPLDEQVSQCAAKLVAAARGTDLEELVSDLIH